MDNLKAVILKIINFLVEVDSGAYFEQTNYLNDLLALIEEKNYDLVYSKLNSIEMWGGAGSIWESEYGMSKDQRDFFEDLLLILLNELTLRSKMSNSSEGVRKILLKFKGQRNSNGGALK